MKFPTPAWGTPVGPLPASAAAAINALLMSTLLRLTVLLCLLMTLGLQSVALAAPACPEASDPRQAQLDAQGVSSAQAGGLSLNVAAACQGFSVVVQGGIEPSLAAEYVTDAEQAYTRLAAEAGETLSPRAVLFVFADQSGMADGERIVGGISAATHEPRAGYAWLNTIWLDNSQHRGADARARAVAHEFSHLFAAVMARGNHIPNWFDEGLAVDSELTLPRAEFGTAAQARADDERTTVLDAVSGQGPLQLYNLDDLSTGAQWQQHYRLPAQQELEYAQAYETVQAAMVGHGRPGAWQVLRALGKGMDFGAAFHTQLGESIEQVDATARADWQNQVNAPADALTLSAHIAAGPDAADVRVEVDAFVDKMFTHLSGTTAPGTTLRFDVQSDGTLAQAGAELDRESQPLDEDDDEGYGTYISIRILRGDSSVESVTLERSYGRWESLPERYLVASDGESRKFVALDGPISDPFPSGDMIAVAH
jgi:hypothetical protein